MRTLQVQFRSGRDVLGHYWGLLSGGGLAIDLDGLNGLDGPDDPVGRDGPQVRDGCTQPDPGDQTHGAPAYCSGEKLGLSVHVLSIKKTYELQVQVLDVRHERQGGPRVIVAFLPDAPPDELLDAAWADGCDAPQRRSRRLPTHTRVRYEPLDGRGTEGRVGHLVNLSAGGCCVEGAGLPQPGTQVMLTTLPEGGAVPQVKLVGRVRWTERPEGGFMGIEFLRSAAEVGSLLQNLLQARPSKLPVP